MDNVISLLPLYTLRFAGVYHKDFECETKETSRQLYESEHSKKNTAKYMIGMNAQKILTKLLLHIIVG
jgi:hypothetical protein